MKHFVKSPYNHDRRQSSLDSATRNTLPSLTVQADKDDCDINVLIRRFGVTGVLNAVQRPPNISEFSEIFDFQDAMNLVRQAEESFASLPADVRVRFNHNPHLYVDFCSQEENLPEMRKMGIAIPEPPVIIPPEPQKVQIVNLQDVPRETKRD